MLDLRLIAVVSAMNTLESIGYLFFTARVKVINQLIEKLLPFAEENYAPACQFIVNHTQDDDQCDYFMRKLASLGDIDALLALYRQISNDAEPTDHVLEHLVRYAHYRCAVDNISLEEVVENEIDYFKRRHAWSEDANRRLKAILKAFVLTPEQIQAARELRQAGVVNHKFVFTARTEEDHQYLRAISDNNCAYVENYLANGGNPFIHYPLALGSALHLAIGLTSEPNRFEMLRILMKAYQRYDFCLNHDVVEGSISPVGYAAQRGYIQAIKMFIEAGIEPDFILWEWCQYHPESTQHPHQAVLDEYLKKHINVLSLRVLPLIQNDNKSIVLDGCGENSTGAESALKKHYIKDNEGLKLVFENRLIYCITTYHHCLNEDYCLLDLRTKLVKVLDEDFFKKLIKFLYEKIMDFFIDLDVSVDVSARTSAESYNVQYKFHRAIFPKVVNLLLGLHQQHTYAIVSDRSISEHAFLNEANEQVQARVGGMLQMGLPSFREMPMLFDYDYAVLMRPFIIEEEKKYYRNFCAIRLVARILAAGAMNRSLLTARDVLIQIASMVGDRKIHSEKKSLKIATDNFQRLPTTTYTPRLFLPSSLVNRPPETSSPPKPC